MCDRRRRAGLLQSEATDAGSNDYGICMLHGIAASYYVFVRYRSVKTMMIMMMMMMMMMV